jgi:hypothetical protein
MRYFSGYGHHHMGKLYGSIYEISEKDFQFDQHMEQYKERELYTPVIYHASNMYLIRTDNTRIEIKTHDKPIWTIITLDDLYRLIPEEKITHAFHKFDVLHFKANTELKQKQLYVDRTKKAHKYEDLEDQLNHLKKQLKILEKQQDQLNADLEEYTNLSQNKNTIFDTDEDKRSNLLKLYPEVEKLL